jgi:hypothetical protein
VVRILRTATTQFTARQGGYHLAQDRDIRRWLERVKYALRGKLCGLLFHAVTRTCAPFAKAIYVKTLLNASFVMDTWSDGLPFTELRKSSW